MKWNEIITEGAELYCPNCNDYMGKPSENDENVTCSNCGEKFKNVGGIKRSKVADEKFGRLVLTGIEVESGTTQGTLQTSKGVKLGSLIQYGPEWFDYDNGKWEAYCTAIKKRKKGFPDKKKAVEWIVRQTRVAMKSQVSEGETVNQYIFGNVIPDWEVEADQGYAAYFSADPMYQPAQVHYEHGKFYVAFHSEDIETFTSAQEAEAHLTKRGNTEFEGWESWSPQTPQNA